MLLRIIVQWIIIFTLHCLFVIFTWEPTCKNASIGGVILRFWRCCCTTKFNWFKTLQVNSVLDSRAEFGNKITGYQLGKRNHLFIFVEHMPSVFDLLWSPNLSIFSTSRYRIRYVPRLKSNVLKTSTAPRKVSDPSARASEKRYLVWRQRFPANFSQSFHQDTTICSTSMEETKGKLDFTHALGEIFRVRLKSDHFRVVPSLCFKARLSAKPRSQSDTFWNLDMAYSFENFRLPCN